MWEGGSWEDSVEWEAVTAVGAEGVHSAESEVGKAEEEAVMVGRMEAAGREEVEEEKA